MAARARGTFDVTITPQTPDDPTEAHSIARMSVVKQFHGDLDATSVGQMLAVDTDVEGSAGYVAMEGVTGRLHGRGGTFALQHNGTMARGVSQLTVTVVPDSGTAELTGLAGTLTIIMTDGRHEYDFDYALADSSIASPPVESSPPTGVDEQGRPGPPDAGDEIATLLGTLERNRATLAWKCGGLDAAGLRATVAA